MQVAILEPHRLHRWVLPLGFLGLGLIFGVVMVLPKDSQATVFWIARLVFVVAYLTLASIGLSRSRRTANVSVDIAGVHVDGRLLVARSSIDQVLSTTSGGLTTIELRGRRPIALEFASAADAETLLDAIEPGRHTANLSFLATTTPTFVVVLAWMGIPVLLSIPVQVMLLDGVGQAGLITYAIPCAMFWLGASWWCMRRRRVTLTTTEIGLPRLFSTRAQVIPLGELTQVTVIQTFTIELRFASRGRRRFKVYDPAVISEFVTRLHERARLA